ncbi:hypothetical protein IW261DRAFT_1677217 [Armillaria novae-zelandiae]|uniref:Uncharacterized protein n=1 Tax=Armillaria novae-zelandiae TaxID=153914 RepID=A0AA39TWU7_9AGAR|nr:hypothetical protein IW261DRAFT_1677217 [Armillaria novae-zelandiae]
MCTTSVSSRRRWHERIETLGAAGNRYTKTKAPKLDLKQKGCSLRVRVETGIGVPNSSDTLHKEANSPEPANTSTPTTTTDPESPGAGNDPDLSSSGQRISSSVMVPRRFKRWSAGYPKEPAVSVPRVMGGERTTWPQTCVPVLLDVMAEGGEPAWTSCSSSADSSPNRCEELLARSVAKEEDIDARLAPGFASALDIRRGLGSNGENKRMGSQWASVGGVGSIRGASGEGIWEDGPLLRDVVVAVEALADKGQDTGGLAAFGRVTRLLVLDGTQEAGEVGLGIWVSRSIDLLVVDLDDSVILGIASATSPSLDDGPDSSQNRCEEFLPCTKCRRAVTRRGFLVSAMKKPRYKASPGQQRGDQAHGHEQDSEGFERLQLGTDQADGRRERRVKPQLERDLGTAPIQTMTRGGGDLGPCRYERRPFDMHLVEACEPSRRSRRC